jgi:hypothetical protein
VRHVQDRAEVEALGLPVVDGRGDVEHLRVADCLLEAAEAQLGQALAYLLGDVLEELTTNSGLPENFSRSSGVLGGDAHRAGVEVTDPLMMQPDTTSGAVANPNSSAPRSAAITDVAPGLELPVGLHDDPVAQPLSSSVCWVSARPSSHGPPACLSDVSGEAPVPPSCRRSAPRRRAPWTPPRRRCRRRPRDQLDVDPRGRVGVLQVVDELLQVLDRVDVVVRRR